jgi:hypothetical protein
VSPSPPLPRAQSLLDKEAKRREGYVQDQLDLYEEMRQEYLDGLEDRK